MSELKGQLGSPKTGIRCRGLAGCAECGTCTSSTWDVVCRWTVLENRLVLMAETFFFIIFVYADAGCRCKFTFDRALASRGRFDSPATAIIARGSPASPARFPISINCTTAPMNLT